MRRPRIWLQAARLSVLVGLFLNGLAYRVWAAPVSSLIERFQECVPDREILLTLAGDCNADGIEDLVVMYRENENENRMVAVYSSNGNFLVSEWTRAPLENYRMQWRDIDERPPVELLVSGQKGIHIGFAVFRFVEGKWISLFGEGMEDCC
ncbi:hypothetical protein JonanDRAFT_0584 [Jonquetella anthropi DSM 22815]|uniref:FG-GAP repeat protein n=1 Tax=Jonquetella anthropi DSM 22815 TaxID=885272 RepID=H0UJX4_9BACT|nr:Cys-Cys-COOH (seleno)protein SaoC [Jonquetella anthropi]EEX48746.1 hypothetical protein GCWU000246_00773 [Jonquetella anthropi E3_33 E1]EHM12984.1 hypothetical protein JonanDRAFT_0584 [Jonquetella anthropi DSM 22815]